MAISIKTQKMLWGRSGFKCAICRTDLAEDITDTDDYSILGEEAHIVAREEKGPRGKSTLTSENRDKYGNLILLCQKHHKIIDDHETEYPVERLQQIKQEHIHWVQSSLNLDIEKQKDDEIYATYIEEFIRLSKLDRWNEWSSFVLGGGQPQIDKQQFNNLETLNEYLLGRIWSKRYPNLDFAFKNFRVILNDFIAVFKYHLDKSDDEMFSTEAFYRAEYRLKQADYDRLLHKYNYHVDLVQDLMCELTRSANHLIEQIRNYIFSSFRTKEGLLLITTGPGPDFKWITARLEYSSKNHEEIVYKGLRDFMTRRESVYHFGEGVNEDYFIGDKLIELMKYIEK